MMKDQDIVLRVQAFVDRELPEAEQAEMAALIARDPDVHALVMELKHTRQALADFDENRELPEGHDFYWSKIEREISRYPQEQTESPRATFVPALLRWLVPAACAAGVLVVGFLFLHNGQSPGDEVAWQAASDKVSAFTYRDYEEGVTVMWLSYPVDDTVAISGEAATIN